MIHKIIKTSISLIVLFLLVTFAWNIIGNRGVSSLQKNKAKTFNKFKESIEEGVFSPVIRLVREEQFVCSGAVISDEYAVTAAHCVSDDSGRMIDKIIVQDETKTTSVKSDVVGLDHRLDYALLFGNFRAFKKFKIDENHSMNRPGAGEKESIAVPKVDPLAVLLGAKTSAAFVSCGFPMGSAKKFCTEFTPQADYNFQIVGIGTLYPGMSGGPVFDPNTNVIVAVSSAVTEQYTIVSPLVGILSCFEVDGP